MMYRRALLQFGAALAVPGSARAQDRYPSRPVRLVIPFAPGGASDALGRMISQRMGASMGATFIVENRSGANGVVGADAVAKGAADGYALLLGFDGTLVIYPHVAKKVPFDPLKDFSPISKIANVPLLLAARSGLAAGGVAELIQLARAKPDVVTFGSAGVGSTGHLVGELLKAQAGIRMTHVPYKGGSAAINDLLGGSLDLMLAAVPAFAPYIAGGRIKLLGVSSAQRVKAFPAVGTFAEAGLPGFDVSSWYGLLAPAGTPDAIVALLQREAVKACREGDMPARLEQLGAVTVAGTPDQFKRDIAVDYARWAQVVKSAGVTLD